MNRKMKIIYTLILFVLVTVCIILCLINKEPIFKLKGNNNIIMEINTNYKEYGYSAKYLNKDISDKVKITSNLNNKKVGNYQITYTLNFRNKEYKKVRTINVIDSSDVVSNILGEGKIEICPNDEYNENEENVIRRDSDKPKISLKGYQSSTMYVGNTYFEAGYNADDNCDGDITDKVSIEGHIDTNKVGKYELVYSVSDSSGNKTSTNRIINIIEEPDVNQKTIYFTFDDGPSSTTTKILDILKEEGIKATFFVINADEKYDKVIKRAYDEGHTIGLHSYSHKYKSIYKSEDAYFDDLNLINNKVKKITGYKSNIIRFPGGSSNTISRISTGLMTKLSIKTKEKGFIYFDWNIASNDTSKISSKRIYKNVVSQLEKYDYNTNVILMHDFQNNNKTVKALKDIIQYGKQNGYRFDKITEMTPQIKHKIRN